jgi:hypothetical protein
MDRLVAGEVLADLLNRLVAGKVLADLLNLLLARCCEHGRS